MSQDKPFSHPRWTEPPEAEVVGHREITEEEKAEADQFIKEMINEVDGEEKKNAKE